MCPPLTVVRRMSSDEGLSTCDPCLESLELWSISEAALGMLSFHLEFGVWLLEALGSTSIIHTLSSKSCVLPSKSVLTLLHFLCLVVLVPVFPDSLI